MDRLEKSEFYAHTKDGEAQGSWQKLFTHLSEVSRIAENFGEDVGISQLAKTVGLFHDLGKYSKEFQNRLENRNIRVDHATAGAKEIIRIFKDKPQEPLAYLLAFCIIGHHSGLPDYGDYSDLPGDGTLIARLKKDICSYDNYLNEIDLSKLDLPARLSLHLNKSHWGFSFAFLTRMIYSMLVDADYLDTEIFIQGAKPRGGHDSLETLLEKLKKYLHQYENPTIGINRKRLETLNHCIQKSIEKPGYFKLTIPTGGGKTLASMSFALHHAVAHGLKRVIYVIPFTTIIEQNAGVFKNIFGEENVLEHHSNFDWEKKKREEINTSDDQTWSVYKKLKLAAENWDIPVVVTTNVQFFESLFANRSSRCRKLHNLSKSVIVFDEAQMFPRDYMLPALSAVQELVSNYGSSAVFCTATQPNLERFLADEPAFIELAPDVNGLFDFYKRVQVTCLKEKLTDDDLVKILRNLDQVLCIVNTRKHASGLFRKLDSENSFHLSSLMCPVHRQQKVEEIRKRLDVVQPCRVISTSVMEAGIDVDFPVGYRALAGLDSINQAAGRINRNMKQVMGELIIFESESELVKRVPRYLAQGVEVTRSVLREHAELPISSQAIHAYFEQLYALNDPRDFDYLDILGKFRIDQKSHPVFKFKTVAENFHIIDDLTQTLIIPFDDNAARLIDELRFAQYPLAILRKLQPYTVSIYEQEFDAISALGVVEMILEKYAVLANKNELYDMDMGLIIPEDKGGNGLYF